MMMQPRTFSALLSLAHRIAAGTEERIDVPLGSGNSSVPRVV